MKAEIGTPLGFSQSGSMVGHWRAGAVKRPFGCAAGAPVSFAMAGVHLLPRQSISSAGGLSVIPSHHTSPSGGRATLVKNAFFAIIAIALGAGLALGAAAAPKKPHS